MLTSPETVLELGFRTGGEVAENAGSGKLNVDITVPRVCTGVYVIAPGPAVGQPASQWRQETCHLYSSSVR